MAAPQVTFFFLFFFCRYRRFTHVLWWVNWSTLIFKSLDWTPKYHQKRAHMQHLTQPQPVLIFEQAWFSLDILFSCPFKLSFVPNSSKSISPVTVIHRSILKFIERLFLKMPHKSLNGKVKYWNLWNLNDKHQTWEKVRVRKRMERGGKRL